MRMKDSLADVLGPRGRAIVTAMQASLRFLDGHDQSTLLDRLGDLIAEVPAFEPIDKSALPDSYGGSQTGPSDDFLAGRGLFYLNEQRRLFLDCTSGHYQMLWGYNHPDLCATIEDATRSGVIWDNHSNIPQSPLKQLAHRLVALANAPGETDPLDKVHLGLCTGSVACATALIQHRPRLGGLRTGQQRRCRSSRCGRSTACQLAAPLPGRARPGGPAKRRLAMGAPSKPGRVARGQRRSPAER